VNTQLGHYPLTALCEALSISRSAYYERLSSQSERSISDEALKPRISEIFWEHKRRYGARRILRELRKVDIYCSRKRVCRLMKEQSLKPIRKRRYVPKTTDSKHGLAVHPNLLLEGVEITGINQVWVTDITYIPLVDSWAYLAIHLDLFSRRIVSWELADHMREELVINSLKKAIKTRGFHPGLIVHSDQGSQYISTGYTKAMRGLRPSMSRKGNCYDNAFMESCFGTLKSEILEEGIFLNLDDARCETFDFIEGYYNNKRMHSSLDYYTPIEFETHKNSA